MLIDIQSELNFLVIELKNYSDRIIETMSGLPKEDVSLQKKKGQNYYVTSYVRNNGSRSYLGKADHPEVAGRLKYQVCRILLQRVDALLDALRKILADGPTTIDLNDLEEELPEKYREFPRELFQDLQLSDRKQMRQQSENQYGGYSKNLCHQTLSGIMVRSKSEQIIADRLYTNQIPFEYEPSVPMKNGPELHPDFRVFHRSQNRWIYIEHFGKISDPSYFGTMKKRFELYFDNGFLLGYDLFPTYDRQDGSIDIHSVDFLIEMLKR